MVSKMMKLLWCCKSKPSVNRASVHSYASWEQAVAWL